MKNISRVLVACILVIFAFSGCGENKEQLYAQWESEHREDWESAAYKEGHEAGLNDGIRCAEAEAEVKAENHEAYVEPEQDDSSFSVAEEKKKSYEEGYSQCYEDMEDGVFYRNGYSDGYPIGYQNGYSTGYQDGIDGEDEEANFDDTVEW